MTQLGPRDVTLKPASPTVGEGEPFKFDGSFTNADPKATHFVLIDWGDGTTTGIGLNAGVNTFTGVHKFVVPFPGATRTVSAIESGNRSVGDR